MADKTYSPNNTARFLTNNFGIIFLAIIFLVSGFFIGKLWTENKNMKLDGSPTQQEKQAEKPTDIPEKKANNLDKMPEITEDDHIQGAENPKIYLVEYSDYECPFCQMFRPTMKQIMEKYGDQIAYIFRHYPLSFHPNAQQAAEAAECVASQSGNDAFWKYTDEIFAQNEQLGGKLSSEAIDAAIKVSGVDIDTVHNCLESGEMTKVVASQFDGGAAAGISGTPGTILMTVDGKYELISGALPLVQIEQVIEKYL